MTTFDLFRNMIKGSLDCFLYIFSIETKIKAPFTGLRADIVIFFFLGKLYLHFQNNPRQRVAVFNHFCFSIYSLHEKNLFRFRCTFNSRCKRNSKLKGKKINKISFQTKRVGGVFHSLKGNHNLTLLIRRNKNQISKPPLRFSYSLLQLYELLMISRRRYSVNIVSV